MNVLTLVSTICECGVVNVYNLAAIYETNLFLIGHKDDGTVQARGLIL